MSPVREARYKIIYYIRFLSTQKCLFVPQICTLGTQTCTICSTISPNIFISTFCHTYWQH